VSEAGVWIEGKAATWDLDDEGETFDPAAFDRGIAAFLTGNRVLAYHHAAKVIETWHDGGASSIVALGAVTDLERRPDGLYFRAWVPTPTRGGFLANVYDQVKAGVLMGVSVGGSFVKEGSRIVEAKLREISLAPWGINPQARLTSVTPVDIAPDLSGTCGEACRLAGAALGKASIGESDLAAELDPLAAFAAELRATREAIEARQRAQVERVQHDLRRDLARMRSWSL
jgi:phage head maturation protease